jgi:hypothetical protein
MLWSHLFKLRNHTILIKFQIWKKLTIRTRGMESKVMGTSLHVTFLDYDYTNDKRLKEELQFLQEEFLIGNFYVFQTRDKGGRHAVCLDALTAKEQKTIVDFSSCDEAFKRAPMINEFRCWVLRIDAKGKRPAPQFIYKVESDFEGTNPQSIGHSHYLLKFGLDIKLRNPIGEDGIYAESYNTSEREDD